MDQTPEQIRADLARFADQLRKLTFPTSPISIELAEFVAGALDEYLSNIGEEGAPGTSLDAAFGLAPKRGRPSDIERTLDVARRIYSLKLKDRSWLQIVEEINGSRGPQIGEREIRRIFETHQHTVRAEEMSRRWAEGDNIDLGEGSK